MPTLRCPSCRRVLQLPEAHDIQTAQCPLCQTTFPVPPAPDEVPPALRPWSPPAAPAARAVEEPLDPPSRRRDEDDDEDEPPRRRRAGPLDPDDAHGPGTGGDRRALLSASGWLKATAALGIAYSLTCGCAGSVLWVDLLGLTDAAATFLVADLLVRLVGFALIWSAAESLDRRRPYALAKTGALVALVFAGVAALVAMPVLVQFTGGPGRAPEQSLLGLLVVLFSLVLFATALTGGVKTLLVLQRPGVRASFRV